MQICKKKISVYVRNKNIRPSDYYRFVQYTKDLDANVVIRSAIPDKIDRWALNPNNSKISRIIALIICYALICFNFFIGNIKDKSDKTDVTIVVREIFPRKIPFFFRKSLIKKCKATRLIWDFDDSIIGTEISDAEADIYFKYADRVVVSTPYLKENLPKEVQRKTDVLCTTDGDLSNIDLSSVNLQRKESFNNLINIVWVATANNMPNLLDVIDYIELAAKELKNKYNKELHLRVVCNKEAERDFKYLKVNNITWTHDVALEEIKTAHIGIMPLMNNKFALGKAGFKLIQYMAGGVPIIASDVGFNSTILNENVGFSVEQNSNEQWINAIINLSNCYDDWEQYSFNSRKEWETKYSYNSHLYFWNKLINE